MPYFCYQAREPDGRIVRGQAVGPGHLDVVQELRKVGYEVLEVWQKPPFVPGERFWSLFGRVPVSELALFTRELAMFFSSGVGLLRGLESIKEQGFSKQTTRAASDVTAAVGQGASLSQAMALRPDVFEGVYRQLIHAGEVSGSLDAILHRLSDYLEKQLILKRRIQSALAYPGLIFLLCVGLTGFLVFFLFPIFVGFFDGLNVKLPTITESLLILSQTLKQPGVILGLLLLPLLLSKLYDKLSANEAVVAWYSNWLLGVPIIGPLKRAVIMARFSSTLSILLRSGIPQFTALSIVGRTLGNRAGELAIERAVGLIRDDGDSLSEALAKEPLFPRMLVSLILVGEEVGDLPRVLDLASEGFEMDVDTTLTRLTVFVEPLMLSVMGFIVGYVLLAVFLPVYGMLEGL